MKVYVVMGNDYPDRVFADEKDAEDYRREQSTQADKRGFPRIHWRVYAFDLIPSRQ